MTIPLANIIEQILGPIIDVLDWILVQIHGVVGSWGLAIIGLTILVRALLIPLTMKQIKSMQAMQRLQPEIKALQAKYKDDKPKLNEELMKFYRENQINPLGSCLPLVAQFPVFIALFYMLRTDLKKDICPGITQYAASQGKALSSVTCGQYQPGGSAQSFLFIPDLTAAATGAVLIALLVMYIGSQLGSSLMMTATMDKTQRYIMLGMPLVFTFFILGFPAGLLVYWITTNLWTVGQQYVVKRSSGGLKPAEMAPAAVAAAATAGTGGGGEGADQAGKPRGSGKARKSAEAGGSGNGSKPAAKSGPPPKRNKKKRTGRRR